MQFSELSEYLEKLEKTPARLEITSILAKLYKELEFEEADVTTYLILGGLAPRFDEVVFNVAEKMAIRAIALAFDKKPSEVQMLYKQIGDVGDTILKIKNQKSKIKKLEIADVYRRLKHIAGDEGEGSQDRKIEELAKLLKELDKISAKYVARIVLGKLRLGFSEKTILDALSWMISGDKSQKINLETAYNVLPDAGRLAKLVKTKGIDKATKGVLPVVGIPLAPMLAQRVKSPAEMIEKMREVFVEPKFDGLRVQIHFKKTGFKTGGTVRAFTRNMNEVSWMFPELSEIRKFVHAESVILDSEGIGVDRQRKTLSNFQSTMSRRRKHDIAKISEKVRIKFYLFDVMYLNGKSLVNTPYLERRKILKEIISINESFSVVEFSKTTNPADIENAMKKYIGNGLEGVIVKRANSRYIAGRTAFRWVKMKEVESAKAKLADTLDPVVMGYYVGRGKRNSFGLGGFLVGIIQKQKAKSKKQNDKSKLKISEEKIVTLTKIGTGLSDEQFKELKKRLGKLEIKDKPREYGKVDKTLIPDVWVNPRLVVEVAADEITKSPLHSSGFALRFPRLIRFRDDKSVDQATTLAETKELFKLQ